MEKPEKNNAALLLRLPDDLKATLQREAIKNGRRITSEINTRLRESLQAPSHPGIAPRPTPSAAHYAKDGHTPIQPLTTGLSTGPATLHPTEQSMLQIFRALPAQKQLALLSLFAPD